MKTFIGVKMVTAEPLVKDGKDGYKVVYPDGYESWSPKQVFEDSYIEVKSERVKARTSNLPRINRVELQVDELDKKIIALDNFIENNPIFETLSEDEQKRLLNQVMAMSYYYSILVERINNSNNKNS